MLSAVFLSRAVSIQWAGDRGRIRLVKSMLMSMQLATGDGFFCGMLVVGVNVLVGLFKKTSHLCLRGRTMNRPAARYCAQCGARLRTP